MTRHVKDPAAHVISIDGVGTNRTVKLRCPYCGRVHVHAWPHTDDAHRQAQCGTPGGYWLVLPSTEITQDLALSTQLSPITEGETESCRLRTSKTTARRKRAG